MSLETANDGVMIAENLKRFLWILTVSLSVATVSRMFNWLRQIPYTLLLVIVGLGLAFFEVRLFYLSPELTLLIFLPPLLFEAAWNLNWPDLKRDLAPITLYAVIGSIISVIGTGIALWWFAGLPLAMGLLVGASLAATDPVSVVALFRELGAGQRIKTLMEGESLFNDGVAVVAFGLLVGVAAGTEQFSISGAVGEFLAVVGIGVGAGCLIGFGISYATQRFDLPYVEQSLTLISAYGSYLLTEDLGGSGVIGAVTVGLILGNFGSIIGMAPRTREIVTEFWDFLAFFVNSIVFLLIGDQMSFAKLGANWKPILVAIVAVLLTRSLSIYGLGSLCNQFFKSQIPGREQTILWWGGLRGSVSIALALSVPENLPGRDMIISTVFGAVLFTLLVQGLTIKPLLQKLGLLGNEAIRQQYVTALVQLAALNRAQRYLTNLHNSGEIESQLFNSNFDWVKEKVERIQTELSQLQEQSPQLSEISLEKMKVNEELLLIEAGTYNEFMRAGVLNSSPQLLLREVAEEH